MRRVKFIAPVIALLTIAGFASVAAARSDAAMVGATLTGYQEVPPISTTGTGSFTATVDADSIDYSLSYSGLVGTASASHIHFAQPGVSGGIVAFLCGGGGKPNCPVSGTVTGTIVASDILDLSSQGIAAGEFDEVIAAMKSGATYVNVHSSTFPSGEIRGQVKRM